MSADGMGPTPKRARRQSKDDLEFYETPSSAVEAILPHLPRLSSVLDPCCGKGAILRATGVAPAGCFGIEINEAHQEAREFGRIAYRDALGPERWPLADVILINPGFSLGLRFFARAIQEARGATIAVLLRLAFLETTQRRAFLLQHRPDIYPFSERPSFSGPRIGKRGKPIKGATDANAVAWFVWGPGRGGRWFLFDEVTPMGRV